MRIAIANDALIGVEILRRIVVNLLGYELAWVATDGAEAVNLCALDTPDLILMDMLMPKMDGVEATRQIMERSPCAILIVTASINRYTAKVFAALGYGALDAINIPILASREEEEYTGLLKKIATIARLIPQRSSHSTAKDLPPLIAIGSSAGGPQALKTIISGLSGNFQGVIVIVQHVDPEFAASFVEWLNQQTPIVVEFAISGCCLKPGQVLVANTNENLVLNPDLSLTYEKSSADCFYDSSIDACFKSVACHWPGRGTGVLLTGMGRDGAAGLKMMQEKGWHTIVQNQQSCVVYGMPRAAIELNAAKEILSLESIALRISKFGISNDQSSLTKLSD